MRLITRSDFDGLVCAVFLKKLGIIDTFTFAHPKDLQDGLVSVTNNDCLANVPFVEGCGLWFDHHCSETERNAYKGKYVGDSRNADSAAQVVYDYYGGKERLPQYQELLDAVNKVDSAKLSHDEILNPTKGVLLGFIMDPRTGLGRFRNFSISNYELMGKLIDYCAEMSVEQILNLPDVKERIDFYFEQTKLFTEMVKKHTRIEKDAIISDLRGVEPIYTGNRFMIYSLYPEQNISIWIVSGKAGKGCSVAVGYSVLNRTSNVDVGSLMLKYGGGGHRQVGTCQFDDDIMDEKIPMVISEIVNYPK